MLKKKSVVFFTVIFALLCAVPFSACSGTPKKAELPEADYAADDPCMQIAIEEARKGIFNDHGGPFGSVIVKDGKVIGRGHNMVLSENDSTAHGEVEAIRNAEKTLGTYELSGAVLYTTGEPCQMCLAACIWANIEKVYFGCRLEDNADIGFRDESIDEAFGGRETFSDYLIEIDRDACLKLFEEHLTLNRDRY